MKTAEEILETNKKQREFYNHQTRQNLATRLWAGLRNGLLNRTRKAVGIQEEVYETHRRWIGDIATKKVLDLGCFAGNYWSIYLAENAKSYLGIDLSDVGIGRLNARLTHFPNAEARVVDFLSPEFFDTDFDLIYAYGVLHHFPNTDLLIARLQEKLAPGGEIIAYDPLETSVPLKLLRSLYRPFQSDAEWEWPFSRKTFRKYRDGFDLIEHHGILGRAKWVALLGFLPLSQESKVRMGRRWHRYDWEMSGVSDRALFACMHLTMRLRKKQSRTLP